MVDGVCSQLHLEPTTALLSSQAEDQSSCIQDLLNINHPTGRISRWVSRRLLHLHSSQLYSREGQIGGSTDFGSDFGRLRATKLHGSLPLLMKSAPCHQGGGCLPYAHTCLSELSLLLLAPFCLSEFTPPTFHSHLLELSLPLEPWQIKFKHPVS